MSTPGDAGLGVGPVLHATPFARAVRVPLEYELVSTDLHFSRLKRVRELLGQDLNDGSTRLDLHLAIRVWRTLESLRLTE